MRFVSKVLGFVVRFRPTSESEIFAMANLKTKKTGVEGVIIYASTGFAGGKRLRHGPRIKVYLGTSPLGGKDVTVTIAKEPKVLNGKLTAALTKDVFKFIHINYDLLLEYWEDKIDIDDFLAKLKKI